MTVKTTSVLRAGRVLAAALAAALAACTKPTTPIAIATMQLLPGLDSIEVGQTFSGWIVVLRDQQGNSLTGRKLTWESRHPAVATVDQDGVVTGITSGGALITVSAEGKTASADIKVLEPITSIVATPDSFDLPLTTARSISVQLVGPGDRP